MANSAKDNLVLAMHDALMDEAEGSEQIEFIQRRPFKHETLKKWQIGFCPPHLIYPSFPYIRGRIITPIWDSYGNVVSLAGRKIESLAENILDHFYEDFGSSKGMDIFATWDRSKWINEPYDKHRHLYGLNINKRDIIQSGYALVVEGNLSVVSLWDHGVKNAIATCGTSLSKFQISLVSRYASQIVILTDSDQAGMNAAEKFVEAFDLWAEETKVLVALLPSGYDPEDYVREFGGRRIKYSIGQAVEKGSQMTELTLLPNSAINIDYE